MPWNRRKSDSVFKIVGLCYLLAAVAAGYILYIVWLVEH